jgi:POT family proton-dependent oligopeptide transporter
MSNTSCPLASCPPGLKSLYCTQTLCNFGFYGIKSIFILYAMSRYTMNDHEAIVLFSTFMSLCYATSLVGGTMADKGLGLRYSIIAGCSLSVVGLLCFLVDGKDFCLFGLALMSLGSGFFKPNLSTAVGIFFDDPGDPRKDKAYSWYYIAMNLGSLTGPIACGFISNRFGWNYGIALIAASFMAATVLFYKNVKFKTHLDPEKHITNKKKLIFLAVILLSSVIPFCLLKIPESFHGLMSITAIGSCVYLAYIFYRCTPIERKDVLTIIGYIVLFALFCSFFEQAGSSLILFFEKAVDRHIAGYVIPSSAFLSLSCLCVLIISPVVVYLSQEKGQHPAPSNTILKMGTGFLFAGLSFWMLAIGACQNTVTVPIKWVIGFTVIQTIGEVLIVPAGFASVSKYAPARFRSVMMSFWLMAIAYGHYFAGFIARLSLDSRQGISASASLLHYGTFFFRLSFMPIIVGIILVIWGRTKKRRLKVLREF